MIAVAMVNDKPEIIHDLHGVIELLQRDYDIDAQDFAEFLKDAAANLSQYPELDPVVDDVIESHKDRLRDMDGLYGDGYFIACEELQNAQEEIRLEIDNLRSKSRKGNTKEDIARRLECIVSNMDGIL